MARYTVRFNEFFDDGPVREVQLDAEDIDALAGSVIPKWASEEYLVSEYFLDTDGGDVWWDVAKGRAYLMRNITAEKVG